MDNILPKNRILNYFDEQIISNKLENDYEEFFPIPFGPFFDITLKSDKNAGWKEERKGLITNREKPVKVYFIDFLDANLNNEKELVIRSFKDYIQTEDDVYEKQLFRDQILYDLSHLKKTAKKKIKMTSEYNRLTQTINDLIKYIMGFPIDPGKVDSNTESSKTTKLIWKKETELYFLIFTYMIHNDYFDVKNNDNNIATIASVLQDIIEVKQLKGEKEFEKGSFLTNINISKAEEQFSKLSNTRPPSELNNFLKNYRNFK